MLQRRAFLLSMAVAAGLPWRSSRAGNREAVAVVVGGRRRVGLPLVWEPSNGLLLGRDGRLWELGDEEMASATSAGPFQPSDASEVRADLIAELGGQYRVTGTPNYLVAYPSAGNANWPATFERLHAAFRRCFQTRGFSLLKSRFPMVAVVTPSQEAMYHTARRAGEEVSGDLLGFYSQLSNRIYLYDHGQTHGGLSSTIWHEAAHQSAYNSNLHARLADAPRWLVEGIGTAFESPYLSGESTVMREKGNVIYRDEFISRFATPKDVAAMLGPLLEDDRYFQRSPRDAYAISWAVTLYLLDRRPAEFRQLLERTSRLLPLQAYPAPRRQADFAELVSGDLAMLAAQVHRFVGSLA